MPLSIAIYMHYCTYKYVVIITSYASKYLYMHGKQIELFGCCAFVCWCDFRLFGIAKIRF